MRKNKFFSFFRLCTGAFRNYELIMIQMNDLLPCMISTSINSHCLLVIRYEVKNSHRWHICKFQYLKLKKQFIRNIVAMPKFTDLTSLVHALPLSKSKLHREFCYFVLYRFILTRNKNYIFLNRCFLTKFLNSSVYYATIILTPRSSYDSHVSLWI